MQGEARIQINASPQRVWSMVSDVTRMGEWSPECQRCEWLEEANEPAVGARFRGYNKAGPWKWATVSTVKAAEPGREFGFQTGITAWRYRLEPSGDGAQVTESYETTGEPGWQRLFYALTGRQKQLDAAIRRTLELLKVAAEGG
ncbi:MAG TPA: SRPBCC family protein [Chloroflexota bacterium]|nr:SRPBCC family protein [Chloroflexota bacterium]